jgi:pimeloyl-ACP methyl ester carboxylesterase
MTREFYVEAADASVLVKIWKPDSGEPGATTPIILLHEGLGCIAMWRDFPARLATASGRHVVAYDRPGHGGSSCRADRALNFDIEATEVFSAIAAELGVERPILYGHSDGATIALLASIASPVQALILEAPHVFLEQSMLLGISRAQVRWDQGELRDRLSKYHGPAVRQMFERWAQFWLQSDSCWSIAERLSGVTAPVFAFQGDNDGYAGAQHLQMIADRCRGPVRKTLIPQCGHAPHREREELVVGMVTEFISRLETTKA